jgi:predicted TIM-barrel fold metal-dependent hydrolase
VSAAVAATWGIGGWQSLVASASDAADGVAALTYHLMKHRLIQDFATVLVAHKLFERFPRLKVAYIENGADWVRPLLHTLQMLHGQNPGMFNTNPVDQFVEHCWVAPFVEDDVEDLAKYLPVERILFGSDWPHAEGLPQPRDFFANVSGFSLSDQRRIMVENARELTFSK